MRVLYWDAFSGIAGDMALGSLLSLGVPLGEVEAILGALPVGGFRLRAFPKRVGAVRATKFDVEVEHGREHGHRKFREIRRWIEESELAPAVKEKSLAVFARLAEAEGKIHGVPPEDVTFHEVGAVDAVVDVVGTVGALEFLGVRRIFVSELPGGSGTVDSAHGPIPVPAPATVELLRGFRLRAGDGSGELVTPTGAALLAGLAETDSEPPPFRVESVGYGAGSRTLRDRPNVLRAVLGEVDDAWEQDEVVVLETNVDDMSPEFYDYVLEKLFEQGALDVFLVPAQMKKNRPGVLLRVLGRPEDRSRLARVLLLETSTLGVRVSRARRWKLPRRTEEVECPYGRVRVKVAEGGEGPPTVAPEYEDCKALARSSGVPLREVYRSALLAYFRKEG
ncbi:MAG: UPF0272 protein [Candidatus Binatia bacterium]|nr:MAG: UPF0272 protein [Candidatus Binatia bacterium]